jgi:hypothetical protein
MFLPEELFFQLIPEENMVFRDALSLASEDSSDLSKNSL